MSLPCVHGASACLFELQDAGNVIHVTGPDQTSLSTSVSVTRAACVCVVLWQHACVCCDVLTEPHRIVLVIERRRRLLKERCPSGTHSGCVCVASGVKCQ